MSKKGVFPIKGFREGLLLTVGDGEWKTILPALLDQIDERSTFFEGAKLAVDVGERTMRAADVSQLRDQLSERRVTLFALLSKSVATETVAATLGLSTRQSVLKANPDDLPRARHDGETAMLLKKTLRSGTSVKFAGSVIVDGDVNPGAEVVAAGSIYVLGYLRGSAHAGIEGTGNEIIAAFQLDSTNLRIGECMYEPTRSIKLKRKKKAQKAVLDGNIIKLIEWEFI